MPTLIAIISLGGLIAGLLGDGAPDVLANLGLAVPVVVVGHFLRKARRTA